MFHSFVPSSCTHLGKHFPLQIVNKKERDLYKKWNQKRKCETTKRDQDQLITVCEESFQTTFIIKKLQSHHSNAGRYGQDAFCVILVLFTTHTGNWRVQYDLKLYKCLNNPKSFHYSKSPAIHSKNKIEFLQTDWWNSHGRLFFVRWISCCTWKRV